MALSWAKNSRTFLRHHVADHAIDEIY